MSTTAEGQAGEHWTVREVRERYARVPPVGSWQEAQELVEALLRQIGTFPEKVTVCNVDGIPPARLAGVEAIFAVGTTPAACDDRYTLTRRDALKAQAVWQEISKCLRALNAWPRIPVDMALRFDDSGAITPLWGEHVLQYLPEASDGPSQVTFRDVIIGALRDAGEDGASVDSLFARVAEVLRAEEAMLGRDDFVALLEVLWTDRQAEKNNFGQWRLVPQQVNEPSQ